MVAALVKPGQTILDQMNGRDAGLMHAVLGISGEAGELVDAIKKKIIYGKAIDVPNIVEELGDMEFYMEDLRRHLGITREQCLAGNMSKLAQRYPSFRYTDAAAIARADKT